MEHKKNEAAGIERLEQTLVRLELELQERYAQIGKSFLEMASHEQKEVNLLVDKIIHIRKKLTRAKREIQCPACLSYNPADSRFCRHCGQKLPLQTS